MKHLLILAILALSGCTLTSPNQSTAFIGARQIAYFGYDDVIELSNSTSRVLLAPAMGGKVLSYTLNGKESLVVDEAEQGWLFEQTQNPHPFNGSGRFDVGNPRTLPEHPELQVGRWHGEIMGDRQAKLTSMVDPATGLQLTRTFTLDEVSSKLRIEMTMTNVTQEEVVAHFWTRTFAKGGGIFMMPLQDYTFYPKGYVQFNPAEQAILIAPPEDPNIAMQEDILVVYDAPQRPKFGMETYADWCAYLTTNDLLMLRQFPTYRERVYSDIISGNFSLYYNNNYHGKAVAEIEPIGPREILKQGQTAHFWEVWQLEDYAFPAERRSVSVADIKARIQAFKQ